MPYLYLVASVICMSTSSVFGSFYNRKNVGRKNTSPLYNFLQLITVCVGWWVLFLMDFSFDPTVLLYALGFGACYTLCTIALINALKTGPITLTSLFSQLSLIAVTIWGFIFWDEPISPIVIVGLVLVVVAITLCLYKGKEANAKGFSWKWLIFAVLAFAGNAGCTIIQNTQQMVFEEKHGNMLMAFATLISMIVCAVVFFRSDKSDAKLIAKTSWFFPVLAGAFNIVLNVCVMKMATSTIPASLRFPVLAVGGLTITTFFSVLVFKERLKWWQWVGFVLGVISVVLLSI